MTPGPLADGIAPCSAPGTAGPLDALPLPELMGELGPPAAPGARRGLRLKRDDAPPADAPNPGRLLAMPLGRESPERGAPGRNPPLEPGR